MKRTDFSKKHSELMVTLKSFLLLCKKLNLECFAAYGTLLGVVRHKGFIPWDDDIDLFLLRDDYNNLIRYFSEKKNAENEHIQCLELNNNYHFVFAKYSDGVLNNTIDIFPLDTVDCDFSSEHMSKILKLKRIISSKVALENNKKEFFLKKLLRKYRCRKYKNMTSHQIAKDLDFYCKSVVKPHSKYLISFGAIKKSEFCIVERSFYETAVELNFEDVKLLCPSNYEIILSKIYGKSWMKPPRKSQMKGHRNA